MSVQPSRMKDVFDTLEEQGCVLKRTKNGWLVLFPNGTSTAVHLTPSDHRAELNFRSTVKRAGLRWPFDKHR